MKSIFNTKSLMWIIVMASMGMVVFLSPISAQAGNITRLRAVPAEQTIENDVFLTGEKPVLSGTVDGDVFIVGSNVTIDGNVNGSLFVIAKSIVMPGNVNGSMYAAALELTQQSGSEIGRSLYALAVSLILEEGSAINRNLNTVAISASLQGETVQDTSAIIGLWAILKIIRDYFNQNITGTLPATEPSSTSMKYQEVVLISAGSAHRVLLRAADPIDSTVLTEWFITASKSFLNLLVVGLLTLWLLPRLFQRSVEQVRKRPLASAGYGTVLLINGYLIPILCLVILIVLSLGLIYISLPTLAWMIFWLALGLLITAFILFLLAATFLSKVVIAYLAGELILSYLARGTVRYRIFPLLLGLLIYVPLATIPYLGLAIGLVVTLLGLGAIWLSRKQAPQLVEPDSYPEVMVEAVSPVEAGANPVNVVDVESTDSKPKARKSARKQ